jgi:hypothetical protein
MKKYIDAEKLIAEIEQLKEANKTSTKHVSEYVQGGIYGFDLAVEKTLAIITSLQQEQPEVDFKKEIDDELDRNWNGYYIEYRRFVESAKYFYKLGLNTRK